MDNNPIGDYSGNIKIIKEENGTRVSDIEEFCEELSILDSTKNAKSKKTSGQTTFDNFI